MVSDGGSNVPSEAALCRGSTIDCEFSPELHAAAHNNAAQAADKAATAAMAADHRRCGRRADANVSTAKTALRSAESALSSADDCPPSLRSAETALRSSRLP